MRQRDELVNQHTSKKCLFLGYSDTSMLILCLQDLQVRQLRTVNVFDGEFLDRAELKNLGLLIDSSIIADIAPHSDTTLKLDGFYETNAATEIFSDNSDVSANAGPEGDVSATLESILDNTNQRDQFSSQVEGEREDDEQEARTLSESHFDSGSGTGQYDEPTSNSLDFRRKSPVDYTEEDVEWHRSFGKRFAHENSDESWSGTSSELSSYYCTLGTKGKLDLGIGLSHTCLNSKAEMYIDEPSSFSEASMDPRWVQSMQEEMKSLLELQTWKLVDLPPGRKIVKNRWVYKKKSDGRLKSRLVAKGFTQTRGLDFDETWSPVGRKSSLKLLIHFVLMNRWSWRQMDVDTAFLNSKLHEEIYMAQPVGFEDGSARVCRLLKSVYGLKQASREWYNTLSEFLLSLGFQRSRIDPCLYMQSGIIIFTYVDDIIIAAATQILVDEVSSKFKERFRMKDMGTPRRILGLDIIECSQGIHLSSKGMIEDLLKRCQFQNSRPVSTPMDFNQVFVSNEKICSQEDQQLFSSLMGSLLYIAGSFIPDITCAVSVLSQFTSNPSEEHFRGLKRILRYLNGTKDFGLLFSNDDVSNYQLRG